MEPRYSPRHAASGMIKLGLNAVCSYFGETARHQPEALARAAPRLTSALANASG
jgi:hypothetical protein